jgi:DNA-binding HxlR family transcriptional regulator
VVSSRPIHREYAVTQKGEMIESILELLAEFSMKYEPKIIFNDGRSREMKEVLGDNI